jgi:hypothetical protein
VPVRSSWVVPVPYYAVPVARPVVYYGGYYGGKHRGHGRHGWHRGHGDCD